MSRGGVVVVVLELWGEHERVSKRAGEDERVGGRRAARGSKRIRRLRGSTSCSRSALAGPDGASAAPAAVAGGASRVAGGASRTRRSASKVHQLHQHYIKISWTHEIQSLVVVLRQLATVALRLSRVRHRLDCSSNVRPRWWRRRIERHVVRQRWPTRTIALSSSFSSLRGHTHVATRLGTNSCAPTPIPPPTDGGALAEANPLALSGPPKLGTKTAALAAPATEKGVEEALERRRGQLWFDEVRRRERRVREESGGSGRRIILQGSAQGCQLARMK